MSYHAQGINPVPAGADIGPAWGEWVEDSIDAMAPLTTEKSHFRAYRSTAQTFTVTDNQEVSAQMMYDTEAFDNLNEYNTSTCKFTATEAGVYYFYASVVFEPSGSPVLPVGSIILMVINQFRGVNYVASTASQSVVQAHILNGANRSQIYSHASVLFDMQAGDTAYVQLTVVTAANGAYNTFNTAVGNSFAGFRIS